MACDVDSYEDFADNIVEYLFLNLPKCPKSKRKKIQVLEIENIFQTFLFIDYLTEYDSSNNGSLFRNIMYITKYIYKSTFVLGILAVLIPSGRFYCRGHYDIFIYFF